MSSYACHICPGTGRTTATSALGLGSPCPHLHRDWAHRCPHRDWAHPAHVCAGTGLTPPTSAPGLGSPCGTKPMCAAVLRKDGLGAQLRDGLAVVQDSNVGTLTEIISAPSKNISTLHRSNGTLHRILLAGGRTAAAEWRFSLRSPRAVTTVEQSAALAMQNTAVRSL